MFFRTLFSIPIEHETASEVFHEFRTYRRTQPILNIVGFIPMPRWFPRSFRSDTRKAAAKICCLITKLTSERMVGIDAGAAPDDLTKQDHDNR